MKTLYFNENTILAFHIGRGGRFHNAGYLTCLGAHKIGDFTDDLFLYEDGKYYDGAHNEVGLTEYEEKMGVGTIDLDGEYDTTYTIALGDIEYTDHEAWAAVHESDAFTREQVILYFLNDANTEADKMAILDELDVDAAEFEEE